MIYTYIAVKLDCDEIGKLSALKYKAYAVPGPTNGRT